jgi:hypothetical protein
MAKVVYIDGLKAGVCVCDHLFFDRALMLYPDLQILRKFDTDDFLIVGGFVLCMLDVSSTCNGIDVLFFGEGRQDNISLLVAEGYFHQEDNVDYDGCPIYLNENTIVKFVDCSQNLYWDPEKTKTLLYEKVRSSDLSLCMRAFDNLYLYHFYRNHFYQNFLWFQDPEMALQSVDASIERVKKYRKRIQNDLLVKGDDIFLRELKHNLCSIPPVGENVVKEY